MPGRTLTNTFTCMYTAGVKEFKCKRRKDALPKDERKSRNKNMQDIKKLVKAKEEMVEKIKIEGPLNMQGFIY